MANELIVANEVHNGVDCHNAVNVPYTAKGAPVGVASWQHRPYETKQQFGGGEWDERFRPPSQPVNPMAIDAQSNNSSISNHTAGNEKQHRPWPRLLLNGKFRTHSASRTIERLVPNGNRPQGSNEPLASAHSISWMAANAVIKHVFRMGTEELLGLMVRHADLTTKDEKLINKKLVLEVRMDGTDASVRIIMDSEAAKTRLEHELPQRE